jgi:hypothetical protein
MIAPLQPAQIAVTSVAMIRQHTALAMVLLCDSNNFLPPLKSPFSGLILLGSKSSWSVYESLHR